MIKSLVAAAVLTVSVAGYAIAQETTTGAPAGTIPQTQEPPTPKPMHHHHHHHHMKPMKPMKMQPGQTPMSPAPGAAPAAPPQ